MPQKQKSIVSLNTIPNTIFIVIFIVGLGAVAGLWAYEIFKTDKKLPVINGGYENNVMQKNGAIDNEYFGNEFIQVKYPQKDAAIKNPVLISGKANVFEANARVRIKDENENVLADDFITASGWMDKLYPFEKEINYTAPASQNGLIEVFEENAKDGSEINKIIIPVVFGDYVNVLDWQLFSIGEYGFSLKIHPDYKKTREEELEREKLKMKIIVFSKDSEKIGITIDKEPDTIKMMRSVLLDAFRLGPEEWRKSLEYYSNLGLVEFGTEFISKENIETGTCTGIQLLEKKGQKYERNLILTSRNLENMYVTILFEYYTKNAEAEVLKMIETIECTK